MEVSKSKIKIELPYDLAIPLWASCTSMFIAGLFTEAKTWKKLECPLTGEWIKKMWYIYTTEYYLVIKKNEIMPFATTWLDLEIIILSEVSQTEKDKYHMTSLYGRKRRRTKEPLDESERGERKSWLKTGPITSWEIDGETVETVRFYFGRLQNHCTW